MGRFAGGPGGIDPNIMEALRQRAQQNGANPINMERWGQPPVMSDDMGEMPPAQIGAGQPAVQPRPGRQDLSGVHGNTITGRGGHEQTLGRAAMSRLPAPVPPQPQFPGPSGPLVMPGGAGQATVMPVPGDLMPTEPGGSPWGVDMPMGGPNADPRLMEILDRVRGGFSGGPVGGTAPHTSRIAPPGVRSRPAAPTAAAGAAAPAGNAPKPGAATAPMPAPAAGTPVGKLPAAPSLVAASPEGPAFDDMMQKLKGGGGFTSMASGRRNAAR